MAMQLLEVVVAQHGLNLGIVFHKRVVSISTLANCYNR